MLAEVSRSNILWKVIQSGSKYAQEVNKKMNYNNEINNELLRNCVTFLLSALKPIRRLRNNKHYATLHIAVLVS